MSTYDFNTNKRQEETKHLNPNKYLKLFNDLDDGIRLSRRIYRDIISRVER